MHEGTQHAQIVCMWVLSRYRAKIVYGGTNFATQNNFGAKSVPALPNSEKGPL